MKLKLTWLLTLSMAFVMHFSFAQEKTVTGTVTTASDGLPLPGANVIVKGTSTGTQTDFDGNYTIKVSATDVIVFSYVGMKTVERVVGTSTTIDISFESDNTLDEVVVIGYGSDSRAKITTAVSTVSAQEVNNIAIGNVGQILQGRVAGARISSGSGQPGADPNVIIRGVGSISGSGLQPLYVIDGAPVESGVFSSLNPNDIENVTVLKDAASQAIYGSRGAQGVILITTKKGREGNTVIQYSSQVGYSEPGEANFSMMNSRELLEFQRVVSRGAGAGLTDAQIDDLARTNTDWEDAFFRTGTTTSHDLSISGGNEKTQFRTSLGIFSQEGIALRSSLDRYSGSMNLTHKISDKITVTTSLIGSFSRSTFIDSENAVALQNPFAAAYLAAPYNPIFNEDGTYATGGGFVGANAYEHLLENDNTTERIRATYNASVQYDPTDWLTVRAFGSADFRESINVDFERPGTFYGDTTNPGQSGEFSPSYSRGTVFSGNVSLEYHKIFAEKHDLSVQGFYEFVSDRSIDPFNFNFRVFGLNENAPPSIGAGTVGATTLPTVGGQNGDPVNLRSYFARVRYGFDNRFQLTLTGRQDESSRFAENNQRAYFWSAGLAWNIDQESWMQSIDFVNDLKLRFSAGTVGNQGSIGILQAQTLFGSGQYLGTPTTTLGTPANPDLKWETIKTLNLGIDFGLWNRRITGSVDVYEKTTSDLFVDKILSGTTGFGVQEVNAGEMVNKGVEAELNVTVVDGRNGGFGLDIFGNIAYNDNEITDLGQVDEFEQGTSILREGLPFGTHYIVGWAGVNPANGEPLYLDGNRAVTNVYSDDNRLTDYGTYISPFTGGFGANISWDGFYLNTLFTFENDFSRFNNQTFFQENPNFAQFNQRTIMNTMWQNPGDITEVQSFLFPRQFSSKDIEDASYLRWRQLEIGYDFPSNLLERTFIKGVRIYAQAVNLFTWTEWTGFDPEDNNNIAQYEYPTPRTYTLGMNFTF